MAFKFKSILLKSDFIGFIPQLRIFEETRYKSAFSSILSIIIIIFSVAFVFYSFVDYLNQNPNVLYYKNNDLITNKTYTISNSLLLFQANFICTSDFFHQPKIKISAQDGDKFSIDNIDYEPCELGKNIDIKYKDLLEEIDRIEDYKISSYNCLNFHGKDLTLFNSQNMKKDLERILKIKLESSCEKYIIEFKLITQNDLIEHKNRKNPIIPYYQKNSIRSQDNPINLVFYYNYIKYETDDGYIFPNKKEMNGIGISNTNSYDKEVIDTDLLYVEFRINGASYDYYQRSFIKFQTFLADVMSLINLLITISKVISEFLLYKKMDKDIIRYILTSNNDITQNNNNISKEKQIHQFFDNNYESKIIDIPKSRDSSNEISTKIDSVIENKNENINNIMKNLKIKNIIKSFFCCKDEKTKIINLCEDIIEKDICIESILKRLYLIENEFDILKSKKFVEIENIIDNINSKYNEKSNDKIEKISNQNNEIIK